ncbi:acyl-CoA dehydratase activase [uncultured Campylobacter sp.]|uniref:acyl-CoA dehydratase activase n=1 Tax=uncultured Campylobacter sp. TaxID=218934 RepID=UPI00260C1FD7|nr:acyl-CoA dehydratase activase [uncultured Campylobacter sp.]
MHFIGIDIGSTSSKVAVMDEGGSFCDLFLLPSGFSAVKVARQIKEILEQKGYGEGFVTATGYGRVSVDYADLSMSEILCHGLGAHFLFEPDCTVIDVGGQDTKAIKIEGGKPEDFIMNDKCSAGTGKFLEISANRLGLELSEIYKTARKNPAIKLSSHARFLLRPSSLSANKGRSGRKYRRALP